MRIVWYALSAVYVIALAFASGTLAGHITLGRRAVGAAAGNGMPSALAQWLTLAGVGALAGLGWRWQKGRQKSDAAGSVATDDTAGRAPTVERSPNVVAPAVASTIVIPNVMPARSPSAAAEIPVEKPIEKPIESPKEDSPAPVAEPSVAAAVTPPGPVAAQRGVGTPMFAAIAGPTEGAIDERIAADTRMTADDLAPAKKQSGHQVAPVAEPGSAAEVAAVERPALAVVPPVMRPVQTKASQAPADTEVPGPPLEPAPVAMAPVTPTISGVSSPVRKSTASRAVDPRPRAVRKGYLFAPQIIWGNSRSRIRRASLIAAFTVVTSLVLLYLLGGSLSAAQLALFATVAVVVTFGPLGRTLAATAPSRRLGRTWVQLGTSPAAPATEVSGTIWLSNDRLRAAVRARQSIRPANVRLTCVRGPQDLPRGPLDTNREIWRHGVAVRADRMTFMAQRLGIPFRFDLPDSIGGVHIEEQDSLMWLLSVDTTMNGLELSEQFVLPLHPPQPAAPEQVADRPAAQSLARRAR